VYTVSPFVGSPGSAPAPLAAEPLLDGDGELSARVERAVRTMNAGIATATTIVFASRIQANHIQALASHARRE
jgi:hypothetical protein